MRRALFVLAALAVALGGCWLEPADSRSVSADADDPIRRERMEPVPPEPDPPVSEGDTSRVTPDEAATADPPIPAPPTVTASGWVIPVEGVEVGDLVDTFEAARSEGRTHNAIDILAPRGTPVVAAAAGTVQRLFTSDKGGLTVYVLGTDERTVHYYAHLDAYAPGLKQGQRLRRGALVGEVGDTGNAAPGNTHLHFAVWTIAEGASFWDGEPVNPYGLFTR